MKRVLLALVALLCLSGCRATNTCTLSEQDLIMITSNLVLGPLSEHISDYSTIQPKISSEMDLEFKDSLAQQTDANKEHLRSITIDNYNWCQQGEEETYHIFSHDSYNHSYCVLKVKNSVVLSSEVILLA